MTTIDLSQAEAFFGKMDANIRKAAITRLRKAAVLTFQEITLRIIPARSPTPRNKGSFFGGWRVEELPDGAMVYNSEKHAAFIEYGVRAGNVKSGQRMIQALAEWAVQKGYVERGEALEFAWGLANRMKLRGIFGPAGFGILKEAVEKHIPRLIRLEVEREIANVTK